MNPALFGKNLATSPVTLENSGFYTPISPPGFKPKPVSPCPKVPPPIQAFPRKIARKGEMNKLVAIKVPKSLGLNLPEKNKG